MTSQIIVGVISAIFVAFLTGLVTVAIKYPRFYKRVANGLIVFLIVVSIASSGWQLVIQFASSQVCYSLKSTQEMKKDSIEIISDTFSDCIYSAQKVQSENSFSPFPWMAIINLILFFFLTALLYLPEWLKEDGVRT